MEFKMVEIGKLKENEWNPNEMTDSVFNHLKAEVQRVGFIDPVTARKNGKILEIIDGAHRVRIAKEVGLTEVPVIILEMDEDEAKLQTINLNQIKGEINPVKFAKLLQDLELRVKMEDLQKYLNMPMEQIESYKMLLDMPEDVEGEIKKLAKQPGFHYAFTVREGDREVVEDALKAGEGLGSSDKFVSICTGFLKANNKKNKDKGKDDDEENQ
jgi:ParB family chromosome partitioning protein